MSRKFPPSREDGSFCVVVKFETTQDAANLRDYANEWCSQWVAEHKHWKRPASESEISGEKGPWDYFDIFTGPPYVIKSEEKQLWLRFDAHVYSYWWRDWFAPMMAGLCDAFPELRLQHRISYDCDE